MYWMILIVSMMPHPTVAMPSCEPLYERYREYHREQKLALKKHKLLYETYLRAMRQQYPRCFRAASLKKILAKAPKNRRVRLVKQRPIASPSATSQDDGALKYSLRLLKEKRRYTTLATTGWITFGLSYLPSLLTGLLSTIITDSVEFKLAGLRTMLPVFGAFLNGAEDLQRARFR